MPTVLPADTVGSYLAALQRGAARTSPTVQDRSAYEGPRPCLGWKGHVNIKMEEGGVGLEGASNVGERGSGSGGDAGEGATLHRWIHGVSRGLPCDTVSGSHG